MIETIRVLCDARTVKRRSGRPSHGPPSPRRGTASPPPTHPVITAAPSVEGSGRRLGLKANRCQGLFSKAVGRALFTCSGWMISLAPTLLGPRSIKLRSAHSVMHWLCFLRPTWI